MATIAEVARHAGVGVATVSRVLNGSPAVRDETRKRVLDAIAELGYAPNPAARALSTGRTQSIGVVAPFFTSPSVIERLRGASHVFNGAGYRLVLFDVESPGQDSESFRKLPGGLDGLLSISLCPAEADLARFEAAGMPVVLVDHSHDRVPAVHTDDLAGGRLATEHLLELGHRRIAFIGDVEHNHHGFTSSARRRAGYEQAHAAAGLDVIPELVRRASHGREPAIESTRELLGLAEPPTAIFAASDTQALGVLEAAEALGKDVPRELAVVGYDDIEVARYAGLTTVAQPLRESGARGAALLLAALAGAADGGRQLPVELVIRSTTVSPGRRAAGSSARPRKVRAREWRGQARQDGKRVRS
ncbi:MAG TPA: LacI family DNA-binding transcriptional regulator [Solirubrobacteraceae bacterium]|nr:LacI family DNA-binding transcriptional regulator [Solirubrobacteraceae bacterium]